MINRFFLKLAKYKYRFTLAFFHAIFMLFLSLLWMNSPLVYEDEYFLVRMLTLVKKVIFTAEEKPSADRFLFINVAYNKAFIPHYGEAGEEIGNEVITDRKILANILEKIVHCAQKPQMVVLDVVLESPSEHDSILNIQAQKLGSRFIVSANEANDKVMPPVIPVPYGLASYTIVQEGLLGVTSDAFFKYQPITNKSIKNISLKVFEQIHKNTIKSSYLCNIENNDLLFKSFIIDQPIRFYDLFLAPSEKRYPLLYASDFVQLPIELIEEMVANKLIYIGDFELSDIHETTYGDSPGSLILANQLIALEREEHRIPVLWVIFMLLSFGVLSFEAFGGQSFFLIFINKNFKLNTINKKNNLQSFISILGSVTVIAVLSYFIFDISIGILFLALYFQFIKFIKKMFRWIKFQLSDSDFLQAFYFTHFDSFFG